MMLLFCKFPLWNSMRLDEAWFYPCGIDWKVTSRWVEVNGTDDISWKEAEQVITYWWKITKDKHALITPEMCIKKVTFDLVLMIRLLVCKSVNSERDVNVHVHETQGILTSSQTGSRQDASSWHKLYCVRFLWTAAGASLTRSRCMTLLLHAASFEKMPCERKRGNKNLCWDVNAIKFCSFELQMRVEDESRLFEK